MSLSIIYTLISRGNKIILADYTEFIGNFQQISLLILNKIKRNMKCSIEYNNYTYYYIDENDITYLCVAENMKEEVAFSFLDDLKKKFLANYSMTTIANTYAFQLKDFAEEMKTLVNYYEQNPSHTKLELAQNNLNATADVLRESVEQLLEKNEKLSLMAQKSKNLKDSSDDFRATAVFIKKKEKRKYLKYIILLIVLFVLLCVALYFLLDN